jgi:hypothetical protein
MKLGIKNKKGQLWDVMQDPLSLVVIAFFLIILFIASAASMNFAEKKIKETADQLSIAQQEHYSLQAFLQKPVKVDVNGKMQEMPISDLIRLSQIDPRYKSVLDSEITEMLPDYAIGNESIWEMQFYIPSNKTIIEAIKRK